MSFKKFKHLSIGFLLAAFIGTVSATEAPRKEAVEKNSIGSVIDSKGVISFEFSGIESRPIVSAFMTWVKETKGDIMISPPGRKEAEYFQKMYLDDDGNLSLISENLNADMGMISLGLDPWGPQCSNVFYVLRTTSEDPIVRGLDEAKGASTLAFTYSGCLYKFVFVVADRMSTIEELNTVMVHELGHVWGLDDNELGKESIMNGSYNDMSECITKRDMKELYKKRHASDKLRPEIGCTPKD